MAQTFGEYLMARRIDRRTANPPLIRRIQATPGVAEVTTFYELLETLGKLPQAQEITIQGFWRTYRYALRHRDARALKRRNELG